MKEYVDYKLASLISGLSRPSLAKKANTGEIATRIDTEGYPHKWEYKITDLPEPKRRKYVELISQARGVVKACKTLQFKGDIDDYVEESKKIIIQNGYLTGKEFDFLIENDLL